MKKYTVTFLIFICTLAQAQTDCYRSATLSKVTTESFSAFSLNNFYSFQKNNGEFDNNPNNGNHGFYFPANNTKGMAFSSGLIWIGKQGIAVKGGGTIYNHTSLSPGKIMADGKAEDKSLPSVRIYRVRRDYKTSSFSNEIAKSEGTYQQLYNNYQKDWNEWPAKDGAPYEDVNKNGIYEPSIDIPGVPGAHQTLWFVSNELDENVSSQFGKGRFGLEVQITIWGYEYDGALANTIFRKYKLINKSSQNITDMYSGIFCDLQIGDTDNFAGCDSILGLAYGYNGKETDREYGLTPPAIGFNFVQGPIVDGSGSEYAFKNGRKLLGKKNLQATAFNFFTCGGDNFPWPNYVVANWYSYMKGINPSKGKKFEIPAQFGGGTTAFAYSGDPVSGQGWIDGIPESCGQRYLLLSCGPFNIPVADTQEIVLAELVAAGNTRLNSISKLKDLCMQSQQIYNNYIASDKPIITPSDKFESPAVNFVTSTSQVILNWGQNSEQISRIEKQSLDGYTFQGYNIYQLYPDIEVKDNARLIATFDIADGIKEVQEAYFNKDGSVSFRTEQFGSDSGIKRELTIGTDYFTNQDLIKGYTYSYAVTAYYVSKNNLTYAQNNPLKRKSIEATMCTAKLVFRKSDTGPSYMDKITVSSKIPLNKSYCSVYIYFPAQLTNHDYSIVFGKNGEETNWSLVDNTLKKDILLQQKLIEKTYNDQYENSIFPIVDGLQIRVINPYPAVRPGNAGIVEVKYGGVVLSANEYDEAGAPFSGNSVWQNSNYTGQQNERDQYYLITNSLTNNFIPSNSEYLDFEIRFTQEGSYAITTDQKITTVPFEIWSIGVNTPDDPKDDYRLIPKVDAYSPNYKFWANSLNGNLNLPVSLSLKALKTKDRASETADYGLFRNLCIASGGEGATYKMSQDNGPVSDHFTYNSVSFSSLIFVDADKDGNPPPPGTVIRINTAKPLSVNDEFHFFSNVYTDNKQQNIPGEFRLYQNYPNPFNPRTTINYEIPLDGNVSLKLYDVLGREVATLADEYKNAGSYSVELRMQSAELPSGIYFYRLNCGSFSATKKLILMK